MCATTIIPQNAPACADHAKADKVLDDLTDLCVEVFSTTFNASWDDAWAIATETYDELIAYAEQWDRDAYRDAHGLTDDDMDRLEFEHADDELLSYARGGR